MNRETVPYFSDEKDRADYCKMLELININKSPDNISLVLSEYIKKNKLNLVTNYLSRNPDSGVKNSDAVLTALLSGNGSPIEILNCVNVIYGYEDSGLLYSILLRWSWLPKSEHEKSSAYVYTHSIKELVRLYEINSQCIIEQEKALKLKDDKIMNLEKKLAEVYKDHHMKEELFHEQYENLEWKFKDSEIHKQNIGDALKLILDKYADTTRKNEFLTKELDSLKNKTHDLHGLEKAHLELLKQYQNQCDQLRKDEKTIDPEWLDDNEPLQ